MTQEQKQQCKQIFEHYGEENQLEKLNEESVELAEAVEEFIFYPSTENREHLAEECADTLIMIQQLKEVVGDKVDEFVQYKLNRQLKRIKNENLSSMPKRI